MPNGQMRAELNEGCADGKRDAGGETEDNNISVSWMLDTTPIQGHDRWQSDADMGHHTRTAGATTVIGGTESGCTVATHRTPNQGRRLESSETCCTRIACQE